MKENNAHIRISDTGFIALGPTPEERRITSRINRINTILLALAVAGLWAVVIMIAASH